MNDVLRRIATFFGVRYVVLTAADGEQRVRRVKFVGGVPMADWYAGGIRTVGLLDGGALQNGAYVVSWRPFNSSAQRRLPSPPDGEVWP